MLTVLADDGLSMEEVAAIRASLFLFGGGLHQRPPGDHVTVCTNYYETKNTKLPTIVTIPLGPHPRVPSRCPVLATGCGGKRPAIGYTEQRPSPLCSRPDPMCPCVPRWSG